MVKNLIKFFQHNQPEKENLSFPHHETTFVMLRPQPQHRPCSSYAHSSGLEARLPLF